MSALEDAAASRYVSFTTFRRDGRPVATPVWVARDGDELCFVSEDGTGKVKRLRHTDRVELRPCTIRGQVPEGAPTWSGTATVHRDAGTIARVRAAQRRKYPEARFSDVFLTLGTRLRLVRTPRAAVVIRLAD